MEAIVERCAGLDVHQATVMACVLVGPPNVRVKKDVRTFGTTTEQLEALRDWLKSLGCTEVGMEATGVYWVPVYTVLEGSFKLIVGNAGHMKNVPARKTDVKDAQWIADLVRHGMIQSSFVPPKWQRHLRDLVRYRRSLVEDQASERNRLMKMLELGNIKLSTVVSNVFGKTGRLIVEALIKGEATIEEMTSMALGRLRKKMRQIAPAIRGYLEPHHRELLRLQLSRVETIEADIAKVDTMIDRALAPHGDVMQRLTTMPGVDRNVAAVIVAELGVNMDVFPTHRHAAAWTGVAPGNHESAGKRIRNLRRRGNVYLTTALVQAATAAARTKGSYLKEKFHRIRARRGYKRAAMAVAHHLLVTAYYLIKNATSYEDLGAGYLDQRRKNAVQRSLIKRLESLGLTVTVEPISATGVS